MAQYIIRRFLLSIPVLFGIMFLVFVLARVLPGNPCVDDPRRTRHAGAVPTQFAIRFGLDQPMPVQFLTYLGTVLDGQPGHVHQVPACR